LPAHRSGLGDVILPWTLAAALLLHGTVFLLVVIDWQSIWSHRAAQPAPIPVTLVYEPPPPPPAPPPAETVPPSPLPPLSSGSDTKTEAKATEEPHPALPQPTPPSEPTQSRETKPAKPAHAGEKTPATAPRLSNLGERAVVAPEVHHEAQPAPLFHTIRWPTAHGGTGTHDTEGDPYFNSLRDKVERNRIYPPAAYFAGGSEAVAVYSMVVDPNGALVTITLMDSTGSAILDEAAGNMLRNSAPFGPFPANFPQIRMIIRAELPIYPRR